MELPWVMRKALRLVSELQARACGARCAAQRRAASWRAQASTVALSAAAGAQIRHDDAEFATCLRAGIINVAETYSLKGALRRGLFLGRAAGGQQAATLSRRMLLACSRLWTGNYAAQMRETCALTDAPARARSPSHSGELRSHPRRDLRAGQSRGLAAALMLSGAAHAAGDAPAAVVRVTTEWDEPYGGARAAAAASHRR